MSEIAEKLKALSATQGIMIGSQWRSRKQETERKRLAGGFDLPQVVPGEVIGDSDSAFYLVRHDYPLSDAHGNQTLGAILDSEARHISFSANDDDLEDFDPRKAVFVDTETTGLAGGAGTVTFLVGVGYFAGQTFRLDQCFMRDFDDEEPMLEYLAQRFDQAASIVSYNGKSFDMPLLRTRFITNRLPFKIEGLMHFDLVHAARRFWKTRLGDCSLGNIERNILGIHRQDDVNSAEIPQIWLDYLHTRDARKLEAVFYHHRMDILSLVTLTAFLAKALSVAQGQGFQHREDRLSLVRLHYRRKEYGPVLDLAQDIADSLDDEVLKSECLEMLAFAAKRRNQWDLMEKAWRQVIAACPRHILARHELAKYYEHRARHLNKAKTVCEEAISLLQGQATVQETPSREYSGFQHRLDRIKGKMDKYA